MPRIDAKRENIMLQANCTVHAISVTQTIVDTRFVRSPTTGVVYPSVPPAKVILAKYIAPLIDELKLALFKIGDRTGDNYNYWPIAGVVIDDVRKVPAELDNPNPADENQDHSRGLRNLRPWFVSADNPASNQGTANTMTRIYKAGRPILEHSYMFACMDIDPWMKCLRVHDFIFSFSYLFLVNFGIGSF